MLRPCCIWHQFVPHFIPDLCMLKSAGYRVFHTFPDRSPAAIYILYGCDHAGERNAARRPEAVGLRQGYVDVRAGELHRDPACDV